MCSRFVSSPYEGMHPLPRQRHGQMHCVLLHAEMLRRSSRSHMENARGVPEAEWEPHRRHHGKATIALIPSRSSPASSTAFGLGCDSDGHRTRNRPAVSFKAMTRYFIDSQRMIVCVNLEDENSKNRFKPLLLTARVPGFGCCSF